MKLSIVGMGRVGQAIAFAAVVKGIADELVLVGRSARSATGDALDLRHASCFLHPADIRSGAIDDTAGSDVVIIAVSAPQPNAFIDRRQSAEPNAAIFPPTRSSAGASQSGSDLSGRYQSCRRVDKADVGSFRTADGPSHR